MTVVRKRNAWTRSRERRRRRPKTPAPTTGWVLREFAALTDLSPRSIRYYLQRGVLAAPVFRGTSTRYQRAHLLRALGIRRLQAERVTKLSVIRQRLDVMGEAELLTFVTAQELSEPVRAALQLPPRLAGGAEGNAAFADGPPTPIGRATPFDSSVPGGEVWRRVLLLPGLELNVSAGASPLVQHLVRQIYEHCVGVAGGGGIPVRGDS